jgi:tetratricopeptide (TPR) repeat protein
MARYRLTIFMLVAATLAAGTGAGSWRYFHRPDRRLRLGEEALHRGELARAEQYALELQAAGHEDHAHLLRGEVLLARGQINPAIEHINQIAESDRVLRIKAATTFGLELMKRDARPQAEQLLKYVLSKDPNHLDALRGLAALYFDQGAYLAALRYTQEWSRLVPSDGKPHRFMGIVYMNTGNNNRLAVEELQQALALELSPTEREGCKLDLGEALVREKDFGRALETLESVEDKDQEKALALRGQCLMYLGRSEDLDALLAQAVADYPDNVDFRWLQAGRLLYTGKASDCAAVLETALRLDPHDTHCRYLLSQAYRALGRQAEAAEQVRLLEETQKLTAEIARLTDRAMESPWDAASRARLAQTCERLDRFDEAAAWRKSASACPPPKSDKP